MSHQDNLTYIRRGDALGNCILRVLWTVGFPTFLVASYSVGAVDIQFSSGRLIDQQQICDVSSIFPGDLDGDGDIDVAASCKIDDMIVWYENDGSAPPEFNRHVITQTAVDVRSVFVADLDGDSDEDVLAGSFEDHTIMWYENNGERPPVFTERMITDSACCVKHIFAVDLDRDNDVDVISASHIFEGLTQPTGEQFAWYENDGEKPPGFTKRTIMNTARSPFFIFSSDIERDGDIDILLTSWWDDTISWYENDGETPPEFEMHNITTSAAHPFQVYAADINADGFTDVLSASRLSDTVAWYENSGGLQPNFTRHIISNVEDGVIWMVADDMDNDGDIDVLSNSSRDASTAWYENNGLPQPAFARHVIATHAVADNGRWIFTVDLDRDNDLDVLVAKEHSGGIWYENLFPLVSAVKGSHWSLYE